MNRLLCLLPSWVLIGAMLVAPVVLVLVISFTQAGAYGGIQWGFSWASYQGLLFDTDFTGAMTLDLSYAVIFLRSIIIAGLTTLICLAVGFPVAYFISRQPAKYRNILVLLVAAPFWTDLLVRIYAWVVILADSGLLHSAMDRVGLGFLFPHILYTNSAILLGMVYNYLPLMVLPLYSSLEKLDGRLIEAAADLYARRGVRLWSIIVRLSMPGIISGSLLVFIPAIGDFIAPSLLGGGKNLLLGNLVALQFGAARNWPFGAAIAVVVLVMVLLAGLLSFILRRNKLAGAAS